MSNTIKLSDKQTALLLELYQFRCLLRIFPKEYLTFTAAKQLLGCIKDQSYVMNLNLESCVSRVTF